MVAQASWKNIVVSEEELILFHRSRARELSLQGKGGVKNRAWNLFVGIRSNVSYRGGETKGGRWGGRFVITKVEWIRRYPYTVANFRASMYPWKERSGRWIDVMNSSDGNISGQARGFQRKIVPVGCRYGCNQRDDNRYYRVNPTHPADLGGVIPLPLLPRLLFATVGAKAASVTRMMYPPFPFPPPLRVIYFAETTIVEYAAPWNRNQAVPDPWIFTPLVFDLGAAINRGNDAEWLILPEPRARVKRRAAHNSCRSRNGRKRPLSIATSLNMFNSRQSLPIDCYVVQFWRICLRNLCPLPVLITIIR